MSNDNQTPNLPLLPAPQRRTKLGVLFNTSEPNIAAAGSSSSSITTHNHHDNHDDHRSSSVSFPSPSISPTSSPTNFIMSPFLQPSPYSKSPWIFSSTANSPATGLIGSLVREEGHVYSLASSGNLLYTGSDSKNIRVWKNLREFSGFKSSSGLVKAIVISRDRVFTGHQDGKIRVWKYSESGTTNPHKRVGSLPTTIDYIKCSIKPGSYVEVRRHKSIPWIKHFDVVSCFGVDEDQGLLYSGSWDKTLRVWRLSDSKCLEMVNAHDDAVNAVVVGFDGLVFTGSADGSVKVWRRELVGRNTKHVLVYTLLDRETAVTALAVNADEGFVYAGSSDGLVNFWERGKYALGHGGVMRGHIQAVLCLASAGRLLFSGSADKSICVWRKEAGGLHSCLSVLTGHGGPVKCLAVQEQQDGGGGGGGGGSGREWVVYSGSLDRSVKLWRVSE